MKNLKRYRVRFHLARGDNYMKWQVFDKQNNTKDYFDPDSNCILMRGCVLGNHPATAKRIYDGENKTVCAWVACDEVTVVGRVSLSSISKLTHYKFNPKKNPHWFTDTAKNCDNRKFSVMMTNKRKVYG